MTESLLRTEGLVKRFGGVTATDRCDLDIRRGETHALIGPNGAGKTTLIAQLQGDLSPDAGRIIFDGRDITTMPAHRRAHLGIARSFQITSIFPDFTTLANVAVAVQALDGHAFRFLRRAWSQARLIDPARSTLDSLGLSDRAHVLAADLSHGERRQLELAMALAMRPTLLLLDEPMAGMGRADGLRMTRLLAELKRHHTVVLVEHDMDAVFALADRISVLVAGRTIATGTPEVIRADPRVRAAYLGHRD